MLAVTTPPKMIERNGPRRVSMSLLAGAIAIAVNTALLAAADFIPLVTARGGLLKLLTIYFGSALSRAGAGSGWVGLVLPAPGGTTFQLGFHVVVGLAMALLYAAAVWVANAFVALPWLGEGIAGSHTLGGPGTAYFAAAHTVFFVLPAVLFDSLCPPHGAKVHRNASEY